MTYKLALLWKEDESEQAEEQARKDEETFVPQDIVWEACLLRDECNDLRSLLEKRIACLDERITCLRAIHDCREQAFDQKIDDPVEV